MLSWFGETLLILGVFYLAVPAVVISVTRNAWIRSLLLLVCGVAAGAFMAWLNYAPYMLFLVWLALTNYSLKVMIERFPESETNTLKKVPAFHVSSYLYVVLSCLLAALLST